MVGILSVVRETAFRPIINHRWIFIAIRTIQFCCSIQAIIADAFIGHHPLPHAHDIRKDFKEYVSVIPKVYRNDDELLNTSSLLQNGHAKELILTFGAFDRDFVVDLRLNSNLFSDAYVEKSVGANHGAVQYIPINHTNSHCYYHGRVRGHPSSVAAISTCHGIRGQISVADETFFIEPREQSSFDSVHYVLKNSGYYYGNLSCGQTSFPDPSRWSYTIREKRSASFNVKPTKVLEPTDSDDATRFVELYIVNDFTQYSSFRRDVYAVIRRTKDIINIVNSIYRQLNIYVLLVGIEIWTERNKIAINGNSDDTMNAFLEYRRLHINPFHRNDNAQLIIGEELGNGVIGKAPIMSICTHQSSGGVNGDRQTAVAAVASTVAHEMGHNFGFFHDVDSCDCPDKRCIMSSGGGFGNPSKWSTCSQQQLADAFHQGMDYCLRDMPQLSDVGPVCGNGFVEDREDCDCGLEEQCKNPCCIADTCRLALNATCAAGHCCDLDTCQPKLSATQCRPSREFCDLPEFCDGISEHCPSDVYRENGIECYDKDSGSYCYNGSCKTHDGQCELLWGWTGRMSHRRCFEYFNVMGNAHGHCGFTWINQTFLKCQPQYV